MRPARARCGPPDLEAPFDRGDTVAPVNLRAIEAVAAALHVVDHTIAREESIPTGTAQKSRSRPRPPMIVSAATPVKHVGTGASLGDVVVAAPEDPVPSGAAVQPVTAALALNLSARA